MQIITVAQASEMLGVTERAVVKMIHRGRFPSATMVPNNEQGKRAEQWALVDLEVELVRRQRQAQKDGESPTPESNSPPAPNRP